MSVYIHNVKDGDTLSEISRQYYRDMEYYPLLAKFNNIKNPDLITIGQKIKIPTYLITGSEMKSGNSILKLVRVSSSVISQGTSSIFVDFDTLEKAAIQEGYNLQDRISAFRKIFYDDKGPIKTLLGMTVGGGPWNILISGASSVSLPNSWQNALLPVMQRVRSNAEMKINGEDIDIGHIFAGLDAKNHPTAISLGGGIVKFRSNHEAATFIGDLGSVVAFYIKYSNASFYDTARVRNSQLLNHFYDDQSSNDQKCKVADMNGNMDSFLIIPTKSVFDTFEAYYNQKTGDYSKRALSFFNILSRSTRIEIQEQIFNSAIAVAISMKWLSDVALIFNDPGPGPSLKLPFIGDVGTPTYWEMYWNVSGWVTEMLFEKTQKRAGV